MASATSSLGSNTVSAAAAMESAAVAPVAMPVAAATAAAVDAQAAPVIEAQGEQASAQAPADMTYTTKSLGKAPNVSAVRYVPFSQLQAQYVGFNPDAGILGGKLFAQLQQQHLMAPPIVFSKDVLRGLDVTIPKIYDGSKLGDLFKLEPLLKQLPKLQDALKVHAASAAAEAPMAVATPMSAAAAPTSVEMSAPRPKYPREDATAYLYAVFYNPKNDRYNDPKVVDLRAVLNDCLLAERAGQNPDKTALRDKLIACLNAGLPVEVDQPIRWNLQYKEPNPKFFNYEDVTNPFEQLKELIRLKNVWSATPTAAAKK